MPDTTLFDRWSIFHKEMGAGGIQRSFAAHLQYTLAKDRYTSTARDLYHGLALAVRDRVVERWLHTQQTHYKRDAKRVCYLSAEYLTGRLLVNNLINLGIYEAARESLADVGLDLSALAEEEPDPGLGNGGLGRLAACYLDSLSTLEIPAYGYGIRYEFGIFEQAIRDNAQIELPDPWLALGSPWEVPRFERTYRVQFGGWTKGATRLDGRYMVEWRGTNDVVGIAHDTPVTGFGTHTVNTLRLWAARATTEFDLDYFQHGDYLKAVEEKNLSETISKVLYPNDSTSAGRELRLRQQYFFVSCSIQDIVRRYLVEHDSFDAFPDKVAIQLNDTHPALAVLELMRVLLDEHGLPWEQAWDLTRRTCAYTNHTLLPEALERWPVPMFERLLPRHLEIVFEVNRRFLRDVAALYPNDAGRLGRTSLIEEGRAKRIRMAHVAIVGSHSVNGVSALHTRLLTNRLLPDFNDIFPERFNNKTNGVTPRRWLLAANPGLARLISGAIGDRWPRDLDELERLVPLAEDAAFREKFGAVKRDNKRRMAALVKDLTGEAVDPESAFDVQVKRFHLYKRQLLNVLHVVAAWLQLKDGETEAPAPRTWLLGGKAAPGYALAKLVIRLVGQVGEMINRDRTTRDRIRLVFLPNYRVTLAERLIPAADVSEQISTAGFEASGTGNMKFALNGAPTIGTLDGANIEIREAVGEEAFFEFGLTAEEVEALRPDYRPRDYVETDPLLGRVIELIRNGFFCPEEPGLFRPLVDDLLDQDHFMVLADFRAYMARQADVGRALLDPDAWTRTAILNVARSGRFSSDRAVAEYNRDIWHAKPVHVDAGDAE